MGDPVTTGISFLSGLSGFGNSAPAGPAMSYGAPVTVGGLTVNRGPQWPQLVAGVVVIGVIAWALSR